MSYNYNKHQQASRKARDAGYSNMPGGQVPTVGQLDLSQPLVRLFSGTPVDLLVRSFRGERGQERIGFKVQYKGHEELRSVDTNDNVWADPIVNVLHRTVPPKISTHINPDARSQGIPALRDLDWTRPVTTRSGRRVTRITDGITMPGTNAPGMVIEVASQSGRDPGQRILVRADTNHDDPVANPDSGWFQPMPGYGHVAGGQVSQASPVMGGSQVHVDGVLNIHPR